MGDVDQDIPLNESEDKYFIFLSPDDDYFDDVPGEDINEVANKTFPAVIPNVSFHIRDLNAQKAASFFPVFIVFGLIVVLSLLCNIVVCYIYRCRSRRSTSNFFFIFFAIFDICGCLVGFPAEILDLTLPYMYDIIPLCKIMGFLKTWFICGLCLTLICVACNCYKKVCRPNEEFGVKNARNCCIFAVILALLFSIPSLVVFGTKEVLTIYPGVFGKTCSVDPALQRWLRILYYTCVLAPFTISLIMMTVFYCLIGICLCKRRQAEDRGEKPSPVKREFPKTHRFIKEDSSTSSVRNEEFSRLQSPAKVSYSPKASHGDPARAPLKTSPIVKSNRLPTNNTGQGSVVMPLHVKTTKQALIFMVISVVFVVFMLPFIVVTTLCASTNYFDKFSSNKTEIAFNICVRFYLLNYIVKPIVYLIFNVNFRMEVKQLLFKVWAMCTRSATEQASSRQLQRSLTMSAPRSTSRTPIYRPPHSST